MNEFELAPIEEWYMDGTISEKIGTMLIMYLHPLNTIEEIEKLRFSIHDQMMEMYNKGQARQNEGIRQR